MGFLIGSKGDVDQSLIGGQSLYMCIYNIAKIEQRHLQKTT